MNQPVIRGIVVDGISIQTTEQGAEAIAKLQATIAEIEAKLAGAQTDHAAAIQAKDAEIGELKIKVADAEKKVPTAEALDILARQRATLIADAQKVAKDLKVEGLTDENIRRAAVTAVYGADMVKDSTDAEVAGMFKAAVGSVKKDPVRDAFKGNGNQNDYKSAEEDHGQSGYEARLRDAYKPAKSA